MITQAVTCALALLAIGCASEPQPPPLQTTPMVRIAPTDVQAKDIIAYINHLKQASDGRWTPAEVEKQDELYQRTVRDGLDSTKAETIAALKKDIEWQVKHERAMALLIPPVGLEELHMDYLRIAKAANASCQVLLRGLETNAYKDEREFSAASMTFLRQTEAKTAAWGRRLAVVVKAANLDIAAFR